MTESCGEYPVRVEPLGALFQARHGEPLMRAAQRNGLRWPTVCQGNGRCSICHVKIVSAEGELAPVEAQEAATLRLIPPALKREATIRLACQLPVTCALVVARAGVTRSAEPDQVGKI